MNRRALLLVPLAGAAAAGGAFLMMLRGMQAGTFNPRGVPSMLIGKRVPPFTLPGQTLADAAEAAGFSDTDLASAGRPVLVNFFASWCVPCVEEHPVLMGLRKAGVPVWGIVYKDTEQNTGTFLQRHGDPFARIGRDPAGRTAIDWGVTGVPETYLIDGQGLVRWRFVGPMVAEVVEQELKPLLQKYMS
jgi:cytochrome c biogenesis protein CcmG, thiol:disulfide interchange protein DsbE